MSRGNRVQKRDQQAIRILPQRGQADVPPGFSPRVKAGASAIGVLAVAWFFVSWLVFNSSLNNAIGETVGSLSVVLLIISIIGAVRS